MVVTWNRRDLLAESLRAIARQSTPPIAVVVVDNASDDGTGAMLSRDFPDADVITAQRNTGGAGGFALGLDRALDYDADTLWLMDDDTVPEPTALEELDRRAGGLRPSGAGRGGLAGGLDRRS